MGYNRYRKRSYNRSKNQNREYAQQMEALEIFFDGLDEWILSSMKDSAYKSFENYEVRLSNHSADNKYHDLENGTLLVNIKTSKLKFQEIIETKLDDILKVVNNLDLEKYRFINIVNGNINCYLKNYKTKKEVFGCGIK